MASRRSGWMHSSAILSVLLGGLTYLGLGEEIGFLVLMTLGIGFLLSVLTYRFRELKGSQQARLNEPGWFERLSVSPRVRLVLFGGLAFLTGALPFLVLFRKALPSQGMHLVLLDPEKGLSSVSVDQRVWIYPSSAWVHLGDSLSIFMPQLLMMGALSVIVMMVFLSTRDRSSQVQAGLKSPWNKETLS